MTSGLISDFVLNALCILRSNTSRLLQLFNRRLDPALLAHCALLPNYEDVQEQLIEMLTNSVNALLNYNKAGEMLSIERMSDWVDTQPLETHLEGLIVSFNDKDSLKVDKLFLKNWVRGNFERICRTTWRTNNGKNPSKELQQDIRAAERMIHREATRYFTTEANFLKMDRDFSVLTHQKSNLKQPSQNPKLSLGSIIKQEVDQTSRYYVCIQQRCDSIRVKQPRQYLFLPLDSVDSNTNFHFVVDEGETYTYLKVDFKTFRLRTISFGPTEGSEVVIDVGVSP